MDLIKEHYQHSPVPEIVGLHRWWVARLPRYFTRVVDCATCLTDAKEKVTRYERQFCREICDGHPSLSVVGVSSPFFTDASAHTVEHKRDDWERV